VQQQKGDKCGIEESNWKWIKVCADVECGGALLVPIIGRRHRFPGAY
jgi:hypothetical protein